MKTSPSSRRWLSWAAAILLSVAAGFAAIGVTQISLERNRRDALATEVKRHATEIMAVTMSGNVMGSAATLGLVNQAIKEVARGETYVQDPLVMDALRSVGESYKATATYVVNRSGVILSNWYSVGRSLGGVNVAYRPYFQIALTGNQNVYAAIGTTTGERALYFAAPLHDTASTESPIIGATVIRLDVNRVDAILRSWSGPALLLSPQNISFASNHDDWTKRIAHDPSPEQLKAIRALKQFGNAFESGKPETLPFDVAQDTTTIAGRRYAVDRAPVRWNDPQGEWSLVLLADLDAVMSASRRTLIGAASGALVLFLSALFLIWRRRLQHADEQRQQAQAELKAYTGKLELDSETKSFLARISADLHQASSLADFAKTFLFHVAPRVEADYGVFYVLNEDGTLLNPVGSHGALTKDLDDVAIGQGLVGQCAKDIKPIAISDSAETPIRIRWGGGVVAPKSVIFLPVAQAHRLQGVIALAALRPIGEEKRAFLEAMLPMLAANLEILERNVGTQRQAEVLQQQQAQLQQTEAWYRGIIESAPDGMLVIDEQGVITITNPQVDAMFGYGAGVLVGQKLEVLVPVEVRERHPGLREGFVRSGNKRAIKELRGVRSDGSEFPVEVGLSVLPALGGEGLCVCASVRDITERHRRDRELADTMTLQQAIFQNAPVGIILSADGKILRVNPRLAEILGGTEQALVGQPGSIIWPSPESYAEFGARAGPLFAQGLPVSEELPFTRLDGSSLFCRLSGRPVSISGYSRSTIWTLEDITERKQSEERLRQVLEDSPAGVAIVDEGGANVFANRRHAEILGVTLEQLKHRRTAEFWADPDARPVFIERLKREGRVDDLEARMRLDDGRTIWVLLNTRWIDFGGQRLLLSWTYDITERKHDEESIRLASEEQAAMFESATLGIAFIKDRVIVRCNGKLNELFGLASEEHIGQSTRIWYPDDDAYAAGGGNVYEALKRGETHQREQLLQRKDGTRFWCRLSGRAIDASDLSRGTVWMLEDITERRRAENELKERMDELERFGRLTVDREGMMIQLKEEINSLLEQMGKDAKYKIVV